MILTLIVVFSVLFVVTHLGLSHGSIRQGLVDKLGQWPFRGLYSFVAFGTILPAAVLWWQNRHLGPVLWEFPFWGEKIVAGMLVFGGMFLLFQLLASPSPAGMMPAKMEARGVLRITRHPMNMGLALWALGHLIANGTVGDVAFFGSFVAIGVLGPFHMDSRMKREKGDTFTDFCRQTSVLPFGAIIRGKNRLALDELSLPLIVIAVAAFAALVFYHGQFFGGELF